MKPTWPASPASIPLCGHACCRWNRQKGPPAAAGAHFVSALGVMSCVEHRDWLRWMPCVLISHEAFKACARKLRRACRREIESKPSPSTPLDCYTTIANISDTGFHSACSTALRIGHASPKVLPALAPLVAYRRFVCCEHFGQAGLSGLAVCRTLPAG